jgi:hypothetical protein
VGEDGVTLVRVRLYRGRCPDPACPVATVTHYPSCLVPYSVFPLATHEAVLQGYAEGRSSAALAETVGLSVKTVRRWLTRTKESLLALGLPEWVASEFADSRKGPWRMSGGPMNRALGTAY